MCYTSLVYYETQPKFCLRLCIFWWIPVTKSLLQLLKLVSVSASSVLCCPATSNLYAIQSDLRQILLCQSWIERLSHRICQIIRKMPNVGLSHKVVKLRKTSLLSNSLAVKSDRPRECHKTCKFNFCVGQTTRTNTFRVISRQLALCAMIHLHLLCTRLWKRDLKGNLNTSS